MTTLNDQLADAAREGDGARVRTLLAQGADAHAFDDGDEMAIAAIAVGPDVMAALLDAGVDANLTDEIGITLLMGAAINRDWAQLELLLSRGASAVSVDEEGRSALAHLLEGNEDHDDDPLPAIRALLAAGANPNRARGDGWTPLMLAAHSGPRAVLELLLDAGADPAATKGEGTTALEIAELCERTEVVQLLRARGATDGQALRAELVQSCWHEIAAWWAKFPDRCRPRNEGSTDDALAALEALIGRPLPDDFRSFLRLQNEQIIDFFEYSGLATDGIAHRWSSLEALRTNGVFATFEPKELYRESPAVEWVWWHPGWIPFAEDGGGNLICIDLAPREHGNLGQVICWEIHSGPVGPTSGSFSAYLRRHHDELLAGRYLYDPETGGRYRD